MTTQTMTIQLARTAPIGALLLRLILFSIGPFIGGSRLGSVGWLRPRPSLIR
jgi:hypothetical protein